MTVSTTTRKAGPFTGNDVTTAFPFVFHVFSTTDVLVVTALIATGVETTNVLGVDYSVVLNADQDANPGGTVTMLAPLASTKTMIITSQVPQTQLTLVTNAGGFFPKVFNAVFDKAVILVQQIAEKITRTITIPITATGVTSLQIPVVASGVIQWKPDGTGLQAVTLPDLSLSLALPPQGGHANHPLFSNGAIAGWRAIAISDVTGLQNTINYCLATVQLVPTLAQINATVQAGIAAALAQQAATTAANNAFLFTAALVF